MGGLVPAKCGATNLKLLSTYLFEVIKSVFEFVVLLFGDLIIFDKSLSVIIGGGWLFLLAICVVWLLRGDFCLLFLYGVTRVVHLFFSIVMFKITTCSRFILLRYHHRSRLMYLV